MSAMTVPMPVERHRLSLADLFSLARPARLLDLTAQRLHGGGGGIRLSRFKGRGMEYDESRPYMPGDDARHLDWRVTARTGRAHTKIFCEETERPVLIWLDMRATMRFASRGWYKVVQAVRAAALLAWAAEQRGDCVGCITFSDYVHHEFRPQRGRAALLRLLLHWTSAWDEQVPIRSTTTSSTRAALIRLARVARPGSLLFLAGDFRDLSKNDESCLVKISRHSELMPMLFSDPLEWQFPPSGIYHMSDGFRTVKLATNRQQMERLYHARFEQRKERLRRTMRRAGAKLLECTTMQDPVEILQQALRGRRP